MLKRCLSTSGTLVFGRGLLRIYRPPQARSVCLSDILQLQLGKLGPALSNTIQQVLIIVPGHMGSSRAPEDPGLLVTLVGRDPFLARGADFLVCTRWSQANADTTSLNQDTGVTAHNNGDCAGFVTSRSAGSCSTPEARSLPFAPAQAFSAFSIFLSRACTCYMRAAAILADLLPVSLCWPAAARWCSLLQA